jgi:hypothetical protein
MTNHTATATTTITARRIALLFLGVFLGPVMMLSYVGRGVVREMFNVRNGWKRTFLHLDLQA